MRISLMLAGFLLPLAAQAFNPTGLAFSHNDWQLACDNTGTCRAAGYHSDAGENLAVSVLLTRKAGPHTAVSGQVMLGEYGENPALAALPAQFKLSFKVNSKTIGQVAIDKGSLVADLSPEQVNALLLALPRHALWGAAGAVTVGMRGKPMRFESVGLVAAVLHPRPFPVAELSQSGRPTRSLPGAPPGNRGKPHPRQH